MISPSEGRFGPFDRYQSKLATLIGEDAAGAMRLTLAWFVAGLASLILTVPLSLTVDPGSNGAGLALIGCMFLIGVTCFGRFVVVDARSARLASHYLTTQLGHPVRIGAAKLSVGWWQRRIDREKLEPSAV